MKTNKARLLEALLSELDKTSFEGVGSEDMAMELFRRCRKGETIRITHKGVRVSHSEFFEDMQSGPAIKAALERYAL